MNNSLSQLPAIFLTIIFQILFILQLCSAPPGFNYQALARDASGNPMVHSEVDLQIRLLKGEPAGPAVYEELHRAQTGSTGLINVVIGSGEPQDFALIDWSDGPYFLEVTVDGLSMGSTQLMSVPYALYASQSGTPSDDGPWHSMPEASQPGEMMYFNGSEWILIPQGEQGQSLTFCDGFPHWGPCEGLPYIVSITGVNHILVSQGTPEQEVLNMLEPSTTITDSDGNSHTVNLYWSIQGYDPQVPGEYLAEGSFHLPYGVVQSDPPTTLLVTAMVSLGGSGDFGTLMDYDGNLYQSIKIGNQRWMAENLRVLHYADGTPIDGVYAYDGDESLVAHYGRLYTWDAAVAVHRNESDIIEQKDIQGVCPDGWRMPTDDDWQELIQYLGSAGMGGGSLKSTRTEPHSHPRWSPPNSGADNATLFSAYPAGIRQMSGAYRLMGHNAFLWSATESTGLPGDDYPAHLQQDPDKEKGSVESNDNETNMAYFRLLNTHTTEFSLMNLEKQTALSVRCIQG